MVLLCNAFEGSILSFEVVEEEETKRKSPSTRKPPSKPKKKRIHIEEHLKKKVL